ncbi:DUF6290 family protein [Clostridium septicum]|uniref:DUF6290 family protein n=1 Tax=Clostridium septicum TaxID=1504 RepID=UPI0008311135|nr:DUF6290 family protein [Clostridium septicum]
MGILKDLRTIQNAKYNEGNRTERIPVRVTEEEKELIKKMAKCQSLDVSNFIRWVILSKYKNEFIKD